MEIFILSILLSMIFATNIPVVSGDSYFNSGADRDEGDSTHSPPFAEGKLDTSGTAASVNDCSDPALNFISCDDWLQYVPSNGDYQGTTAILDMGLSGSEWEELESSSTGIDIIRYVTPCANDNSKYCEYGGPGIDDPPSDSTLGYQSNNHGIGVSSVFGSVAKDARIIFINTHPNTGLHIGHEEPWQWLYDNAAQYDIDVVSISQSSPYDTSRYKTSLLDLISNVATNHDIFITASIGNNGQYYGDKFPQGHKDVFAVGSVDHEDRSAFLRSHDYKSKKFYYSGAAKWAKDNPDKCEDPNDYPFCTSYGGSVPEDKDAMDFQMPGNGVPILVDEQSYEHWRYKAGTSLSTPYLAAAAMIAVYAYNTGYYDTAGELEDPSTSTVYSLLKSSTYMLGDKTNTWGQYYGYGYVNLYDLYHNANDQGSNDAPSCYEYNGILYC